jgi:hypothetical protein
MSPGDIRGPWEVVPVETGPQHFAQVRSVPTGNLVLTAAVPLILAETMCALVQDMGEEFALSRLFAQSVAPR